MATKNAKVFIFLGLVLVFLLMSSKVSAVKDLAEKKPIEVETIEEDGVTDSKKEISAVQCPGKGCCKQNSAKFVKICLQCCP
ncbi:hypothetical protein MKW98_019801 [Papaver atlanticum]|uniref:Uncharacterized protein n=1 Tax=Papaver atlanticum TaxID=357466 RepID=A0AAD4TFL2_9MAGN|nr:hypothetical protein MKW98_019801 [Papaver atlanticum]